MPFAHAKRSNPGSAHPEPSNPGTVESMAETIGNLNLKGHCKYWLQGNCRYGRRCKYQHKPEYRCIQLRDPSASKDDPLFKCEICQGTKLPTTTQQFPVLSCCAHRFHPECIDSLKAEAQETLKKARERNRDAQRFPRCPTCLLPIYFIVKESRWAMNKKDHEAILCRFLDYTMSRPCRFFEASKEEWARLGRRDENDLMCPFGNRCHYAHTVDGQPYWFTTRRINAMIVEREKHLENEIQKLRDEYVKRGGVVEEDDLAVMYDIVGTDPAAEAVPPAAAADTAPATAANDSEEWERVELPHSTARARTALQFEEARRQHQREMDRREQELQREAQLQAEAREETKRKIEEMVPDPDMTREERRKFFQKKLKFVQECFLEDMGRAAIAERYMHLKWMKRRELLEPKFEEPGFF